MASDDTTLPAAADFLLRSSLYEFYPIRAADRLNIQQIHYYEGTLDAFCAGCGAYSIFRRTFPESTGYMDTSEAVRPHVADVQFACSRDKSHTLWFRVKTMKTEPGDDSSAEVAVIGKIGQWPTVADLHTFAVLKYRQLLGSERYRELTRAIGLASHGVGIGSFVYLRRIFESLIEEAGGKAKESSSFSEEAYQKARMDEKILMLAAHLPPFLVENRGLYGILSKGIHSLSESECLLHFDTVRTGIELVLDERLEVLRREAKIKEAAHAIAKARGEIKG